MPEVKVSEGILQGKELEECLLFAGVPFAKPPVGQLRFKGPVDPECWEGVYDATEFKGCAPQTRPMPGDFYYKEFYSSDKAYDSMSEDCLYLNIWAPKNAENAPVAMWIHGGALNHGHSHEMEFDGVEYAKRGVILVTVNYRLGALGFAGHPWLKAESGHTGNYGILDQIQALKWIHKNIKAFGGNPDKITVFGQSAGCMSAQTLISSPLTKGLISGAILQSAGGYKTGLVSDVSEDYVMRTGQELVHRCDVESLEELRTVPWEKILEVQNEIEEAAYKRGAGLTFEIGIDDYVLNYGYDESIEKNVIADIPYLIGSASADIFMTEEMIAAGDPGPLNAAAHAFAKERKKVSDKPVYTYFFNHKPLGDDAGAFHSSELWYMFGTLDRSWRPKNESDYSLRDRMLKDWTDFIKNGKIDSETMDIIYE